MSDGSKKGSGHNAAALDVAWEVFGFSIAQAAHVGCYWIIACLSAGEYDDPVKRTHLSHAINDVRDNWLTA